MTNTAKPKAAAKPKAEKVKVMAVYESNNDNLTLYGTVFNKAKEDNQFFAEVDADIFQSLIDAGRLSLVK